MISQSRTSRKMMQFLIFASKRYTWLQEVTDWKLWPQLCGYYVGLLEGIKCPWQSKLFTSMTLPNSRRYHVLNTLLLKFFETPTINQQRMTYCAEPIFVRCGFLHNVCIFLAQWEIHVGLFFFQKLLYSGQKHGHGIKFQSVVLPDGHFGCMVFGPIKGIRHESWMLAENEHIPRLREFIPEED